MHRVVEGDEIIRDGDWVLFSIDDAIGETIWHIYDEKTGRLKHQRTDTPFKNTLEHNKEMRNATQGEKWGDWRKVAQIPGTLAHLWLDEAIIQEDRKYVKKFLNDSDNANFRCFDGVL